MAQKIICSTLCVAATTPIVLALPPCVPCSARV